MNNPPDPRIIFMGTPDVSAHFLGSVVQREPKILSALVACFTQPDRPRGRGRQLLPSPVKSWAMAHNIPVFQPETLKSSESLLRLKSLSPTHIWVVAYGLLLPKAVLDMAPCWNVHFSLLPKYRGASPLQQAILRGDPETGVTLMQMDEGLDTGPILAQSTYALTSRTTTPILSEALTNLGAQLIADAFALSLHSVVPLTSQDSRVAEGITPSHAPKFTKSDAMLDFSQPAVTLDRQIRAFLGGITAWFPWKGDRQQPVKIFAARVEPDEVGQAPRSGSPGTILRCDPTGLWVQTGEGVLVFDVIQFPGRRPQACREWIKGKHSFVVGDPI